ncbi:MAG: response regulator [Alphaproteobacteria bacterium]|nr:response regulator [Alphaproteobacteria bacterium]
MHVMLFSPPPFTILLVEDDPADAHLVQAAFIENRVLVDLRHVMDGVEAFNYLRRHGESHRDAVRPDLILLDLNMPRMDGREFLTAIKIDDALRSIPVVILTTSEVERDIVASYKLGAAGYIVKPVDFEQFIAAIKSLKDYWCSVVRVPKTKPTYART